MTKFPYAFVLLLGCSILIITNTQDTIDPCNRPEYCATDTEVPDPEDCTKYYWCVTGSWMRVDCPTGTVYDNVTLECLYPGQAQCQPECPPFTGTTTVRVTQKPGACDADNQTKCVEGEKYPDRSNCLTYYLCLGGVLVPQSCVPGTVFDIYVGECVEPDNDFDCYYRCATPAPTTDVPVTVTSGSTTPVDVTSVSSTSVSSTSVSSTSVSSTSASVPPTTTNTDGSGSGSGNEAALIGIIIGVVVLIIIIIIIVVIVCMKKNKRRKVDPENCCSSFFHRVHLYVVTGKKSRKRAHARKIAVMDCHLMGILATVGDDPRNPIRLPPIVLAAADPGSTDFDHLAFIEKAEKEKRKAIRRYKKNDPSREAAMKESKKYQKKLRKELHRRYEAEEKYENAYYNNILDLLNNDAIVKQQTFRDDLRTASKRNNPTELTALVNNHVNSQHKSTIAGQEVMNGRDEMLRTRLKDMHLSQPDMLTAGLLASDLDGSDVNKRIRRFNEQQEKMKDSYLQKFTSMAASGASLETLEKLTESYESELGTLKENHLQERDQATKRLLKAIDILALQKLDKLWDQECQKVDNRFDYSASPDDDPGVGRVTLAKHMEALKKAGEQVDSHITTRNLSGAVIAAKNPEHELRTSTPLNSNHYVTMATSLPMPTETNTDENDDAGEFRDESIASTTEVNGMVVRSPAPPPSSETLADEQRRILALHQQQVEHLQAMKRQEKSRMDELLRQRLSERQTGARASSVDV